MNSGVARNFCSVFKDGRGSGGRRKPPSGSRAEPWWGSRGRSPRKLMDFLDLAVGFLGFLMMKHCVKMLVLHSVCIKEMLNIKEYSY